MIVVVSKGFILKCNFDSCLLCYRCIVLFVDFDFVSIVCFFFVRCLLILVVIIFEFFCIKIGVLI